MPRGYAYNGTHKFMDDFYDIGEILDKLPSSMGNTPSHILCKFVVHHLGVQNDI